MALQNVRFKTFCLTMLTIENAIASAGLVEASCGRIWSLPSSVDLFSWDEDMSSMICIITSPIASEGVLGLVNKPWAILTK